MPARRRRFAPALADLMVVGSLCVKDSAWVAKRHTPNSGMTRGERNGKLAESKRANESSLADNVT